MPEFFPKLPLTLTSKILSVTESNPRRICFNSCHSNALKLDEKYHSKISLPFSDSFHPIFFKETLCAFLDSKFEPGKIWFPTNHHEKHERIQGFMEKYKQEVFIKDSLSLSIALSENFSITGNERSYTTIGQLENFAKYSKDPKERQSGIIGLYNVLLNKIPTYPFYSTAKYICSVPPSNPGEESLISRLAEAVAKKLGLINLSSLISWKSKKPSLKNIPFNEKWATMESIGIQCNKKLQKCNIILLDDLYQSGLTMQFVSKALSGFGAEFIFGLSIVKSLNNHDNTR